jgi:hypothetical protein
MNQTVKKRETFYLGGYDPRGARYYYNFYKNESALQSKVSEMDISVGKRQRTDKHIQSWEITSQVDNEITDTRYHFLEWDDIIRDEWKKSYMELFFDLIFYFKTYILAGRFIKYSKVSPYQMIGIFLPTVYALLSFVIALFSAYYVYIYFDDYLGLIAGIGMIPLVLYLLVLLGHKLAIFWLLRIFVFSAHYVFDEKKVLETRLDEFASKIIEQMKLAEKNNVDEILLVSHSVGSILSISLLERVLKSIDGTLSCKLSVLTLGECIPLVSGIDKAVEYKEKMAYIAQSNQIFLVDYTTVVDGACFPGLNYFEDVDIKMKYPENFHFYSARFHTLFSKNKYKQLLKNRYVTHFIYFMATEKIGKYNFFEMTAGNQKLSERHEVKDVK